MPATGTIWRHRKRGSVYEIVGRAKMQMETTHIPRIDLVSGFYVKDTMEALSLIVYRSLSDDTLWVRPESEFMDGRFERV